MSRIGVVVFFVFAVFAFLGIWAEEESAVRQTGWAVLSMGLLTVSAIGSVGLQIEAAIRHAGGPTASAGPQSASVASPPQVRTDGVQDRPTTKGPVAWPTGPYETRTGPQPHGWSREWSSGPSALPTEGP